MKRQRSLSSGGGSAAAPAAEPCAGGCAHLDRRACADGMHQALELVCAAQQQPGADAGFACLTCGGAAASPAEHRARHRRGHDVLVDLRRGELFCGRCDDYVYDAEFDRAAAARLAAGRTAAAATAAAAAATSAPLRGAGPPSRPASALARRGSGRDLMAALAGVDADADADAPPPDSGLAPPAFEPLPDGGAPGAPPGLRGLCNMGNTCFMNAVLQALLHAPPLRGHHLLARHARGGCAVAAAGGACVACELDAVFSAAYCGARRPLPPAGFLHAWWQLAGGALAGGAKQQDAHEFFVFVLEMLAAAGGAGAGAARLFSGVLRSDVVCGRCGHASTTHDPFTHLSLEVPPVTRLLPPPPVPRAPSAAAVHGRAGAAAAAAKREKALVGAAARAHSNRLAREAAAAAAAAGAGAAGDGGSGSLSAQLGGGGRPSPPLAASGGPAPRLEQQPEAASGVGSPGGAAPRVDDVFDTLSSPQRSGGAPAAAAAAAAAPAAGGGSSDELRGAGPSADADAATAPRGASPVDTKDGSAGDAALQARTPSPPSAPPGAGLAAFARWPGASLAGCLRRLVRAEPLGPGEHWECPACGAPDAGVKQLSLRALPPLLVLHAKRFEHGGAPRAGATKLHTYLSFPLEGLDARPLLSSAVLRARHGARAPPPARAAAAAAAGGGGAAGGTPASAPPPPPQQQQPLSPGRRTRSQSSLGSPAGSLGGGPARPTSPPPTLPLSPADRRRSGEAPAPAPAPPAGAPPADPADFLYDLFAVVCHRGDFRGGHYVAYVRAADGRWYLCDDALVAPVPRDAVRDCQAYMLFYASRAGSARGAEPAAA